MGREVFVDKLRRKRGEFRTSYKIVTTYKAGSCVAFNDGGFPFEDQIPGGCNHKVKGRTGAFRGANGPITFYDQIPVVGKDATNFFYSGYLKGRSL